MIHITINGTEKFCLAHINSTKSAFLCGEPAHRVIVNYKFNFLRESVLCALSVNIYDVDTVSAAGSVGPFAIASQRSPPETRAPK